MTEPTLAQRVREAAAVIEELQSSPVTNQSAYSANDLRAILHMWTGGNER